ncbi:MAG: YdjY domain-containing protein [Chromatiaceae bacterium]|nr:YdjY domain-containing protein [Chromatiaceae bacterium]
MVSTANVAADPAITDLGNGRYQIGEILVDKAARRFTLTGVVIKDQQPLEYLAVKKAGYKAYESMLELNTTATEFNLACILIGLNAEHAVLPEYHFDPKPVQGDPVAISIEWERDGETRTVSPEQLFLDSGKPVESNTWIYTGSFITRENVYLAEEFGPLIGFVHDKDSIIEHRDGIGLGRLGLVEVDKTIAPLLGTPIRVTVTNLTPPASP